jgi:folate-binding protein YgfZ
MSDNPRTMPDRWFAPANHRVVSLEGRDATAFAQAQFMNDVAALEPGHWQWNGWLTPKGRLVALFVLLKLDGETLRLVVPDADAEALVMALRRFVFRAKVAIALRDEFQAAASFRAPDQARGNVLACHGMDTAEIDLGAPGVPRALTVSPRGDVGPDPALDAQWALCDLAHGLPRLPPSQAEQWTPQQLSLERLAAFSVRKGCYPGQEIVARTHFLGKVKRGLALLESQLPVPVGAEVHDGDRVLGTLISTAGLDARHLALAVLPLDQERGPLRVGDSVVREIALADGLAR